MSTLGNTEPGYPTKPFDTWEDVLRYVADNGAVYYQGALSHHSTLVRARVMAGEDRVLVAPYDREADPFPTDNSYLRCFRQPA